MSNTTAIEILAGVAVLCITAFTVYTAFILTSFWHRVNKLINARHDAEMAQIAAAAELWERWGAKKAKEAE